MMVMMLIMMMVKMMMMMMMMTMMIMMMMMMMMMMTGLMLCSRITSLTEFLIAVWPSRSLQNLNPSEVSPS